MKYRFGIFGALTAATVATIFAMETQSFIPGAGLIALAGLLTLPGTLLLLILQPSKLTKLENVLFGAMLSVLTLMISGLASNELLNAFGNMHPLAAQSQIPWTSALLLILLEIALLRNRKRAFSAQVPRISGKGTALALGLGLLPALTAIGADSLNNGGTNAYTMLAYAAVAGGAVALVAGYKKVAPWVWAWAIFCMGLALLWSTSLRGLYITGHDVQLEYYVFRLTDATKFWSMAHLQDPYNACLSITILPTMLKSLTGIAGMTLYKFVYQILFALCGVGVFGLSRRVYPSSVLAYLSAFIFITFPTFVTDMPMLNRQEIAFLFFAAMLMVVLNRSLNDRTRRYLVIAFAVGIVLSHYSTTFVAIAVLAGSYAVIQGSRIFTWWKKKRLDESIRNSRINLGVLIVMLLSTILWTGIYTKTGGNITATIGNAAKSLPTVLDPKTSNDSSSYSFLKTTVVPPQAQLDEYAKSLGSAASLIKQAQGGGTYADASQYQIKPVNPPVIPTTTLGSFIQKFGIAPGLITSLGKEAYALGLQAAILFGSILAIIYRKHFRLSADFVVLAPIGILFLGVQTVLPVIDYGLFRMLQQDLIFLALPVVLGLMKLLGWLKLSSVRSRVTVLTVGFAVMFLVLSGFTGELLGGTQGQLPLANSGFYYDAYYTNSQDIGTFAWLKDNYVAGTPINSDTFTRMKIMANTGITTIDGITPSALTRNSYVVLTAANVTGDRVALYYNGNLLYYEYPTSFLNDNKNLIFSTNSTSIYQ